MFATLAFNRSYRAVICLSGSCPGTCHILHFHLGGVVRRGGANNVLSPLLLAGASNFVKSCQIYVLHAIGATSQLFCPVVI